MHVPFLDLKAQYATIREEMAAAIEAVMESQQFINGPEVEELEKRLAEYCGCLSAVGVSSGTDALLCTLMAMGVGAGDEVITTPYTFFATAGSIWRTGARPVFVDIDPVSYNIDPTKIEAAVTRRTKAIMPVHLFGQMAVMDPIMQIADMHGLSVVEDAAQAIGAPCVACSVRTPEPMTAPPATGTPWTGRAGSIGTAGCFSFFPSKNLGGMGDGGMIVTQYPGLAERIRRLRSHGAKLKHYHKHVGGNFRLDTIQAAGLLVKLRYLDEWTVKRRANAAKYDELLAGIDDVQTPRIDPNCISVYNQYVIRVRDRRDELRMFLKDAGIGTAVYYPLCMHEQECFRNLGYRRGDFPVAERAAAETLALPIYPELTNEQIQYVADKIVAQAHTIRDPGSVNRDTG